MRSNLSQGPLGMAVAVVGGGALAAVLLSAWQADAAKVRRRPRQEPPTAPASAAAPPSSAASASAAPSTAAALPPSTYPTTGLICLYGRERDEATQRDRCLAPEELHPPRLVIVNSRPLAEQLGMLAQRADDLDAGGGDGGDTGPEAGEPSDDAPFKARVVSVQFENGAVAGALRALRDRTDDMAACVEDHGGLRSDSARLKLLFFVRPDQKASNVIVASARNIPVPVVRCIKKLITEGSIGRPSAEPVGVKALIELKQRPEE